MRLGQSKLHRLNPGILIQKFQADSVRHRFQKLMGRPFHDLPYVAVLMPICCQAHQPWNEERSLHDAASDRPEDVCIADRILQVIGASSLFQAAGEPGVYTELLAQHLFLPRVRKRFSPERLEHSTTRSSPQTCLLQNAVISKKLQPVQQDRVRWKALTVRSLLREALCPHQACKRCLPHEPTAGLHTERPLNPKEKICYSKLWERMSPGSGEQLVCRTEDFQDLNLNFCSQRFEHRDVGAPKHSRHTQRLVLSEHRSGRHFGSTALAEMAESLETVLVQYKGFAQGSITASLNSTIGDLRKAIAQQAAQDTVQLIAGGRKLQVCIQDVFLLQNIHLAQSVPASLRTGSELQDDSKSLQGCGLTSTRTIHVLKVQGNAATTAFQQQETRASSLQRLQHAAEALARRKGDRQVLLLVSQLATCDLQIASNCPQISQCMLTVGLCIS